MADQGKEGLLSPLLRRERFRIVIPYLNGRVLDYGCGTGELAKQIPPWRYRGVDSDPLSLELAQRQFPGHTFSSSAGEEERFETVVALAVVEHVDEPAEFLHRLSEYLSDSPDARLIVTTPHPSLRWAYAVGAKLGLFSRHAYQEHRVLLGREKMVAAGSRAGLKLASCGRFMWGANQLYVFEKARQ